MSIRTFLMKAASAIIHPHCQSSEDFVNYLKKTGVKIGKGTYFFDPASVNLDVGRRTYISIGDYCCITHGCQFLCHDYSWTVLQRSHNLLLPDPGAPIRLGNNVFLGWNTIIIGPVTIGDNVIVGAHSVVTKDLEPNSVYAGNPARKICTLSVFLEKRKQKVLENAVFRARHIYKTTGKMPTMEDMGWFCVLFMPRVEASRSYLKLMSFKGGDIDSAIDSFFCSDAIFDSFDAFLDYAFEKDN